MQMTGLDGKDAPAAPLGLGDEVYKSKHMQHISRIRVPGTAGDDSGRIMDTVGGAAGECAWHACFVACGWLHTAAILSMEEAHLRC